MLSKIIYNYYKEGGSILNRVETNMINWLVIRVKERKSKKNTYIRLNDRLKSIIMKSI